MTIKNMMINLISLTAILSLSSCFLFDRNNSSRGGGNHADVATTTTKYDNLDDCKADLVTALKKQASGYTSDQISKAVGNALSVKGNADKQLSACNSSFSSLLSSAKSILTGSTGTPDDINDDNTDNESKDFAVFYN